VRSALVSMLAIALVATGCSDDSAPYPHTRFDYWSFKGRIGRLPEPNYLPWVMHREDLPGGEEGFVACRWPDDAFPLLYYIAPPLIPTALQDDFSPRDPEDFVESVERAFARWQAEIGRPVRFQRTRARRQADVEVVLEAASNQQDDVRVLGLVRNSGEQCRVTATGSDPDRVEIEFNVDAMHLFVADDVGLLTPRQVYGVALHEIGHLLGAGRRHSPLRGDVMFREADDSRIDMLSEHDRNTFQGLYRLRPGAVYARVEPARVEPMKEIRRSPPVLGEPVRAEDFGFSVRFPKDWQVIPSSRGFVAVDGLTWDYDASIQLIAARGKPDEFVQQQAANARARGHDARIEHLDLDGQPVHRVIVSGPDWTEQTTVQAIADDWMLVIVADCAARDYELYRTWFHNVLLSIERLPVMF